MNSRMPRVVLSGILGGTLVGFLIGMYVVVLTESHVIRRDDYAAALFHEQAQLRYVSTVLQAFVVVFAAIGPVVASASFGGWIRHAIYGLVSAIALVVCVTLVAAALTGQQPINMMRESPSTYINFARIYAMIKQHLFCKSRISEVGHLASMFR
jgi:predicted small integral membrane protein